MGASASAEDGEKKLVDGVSSSRADFLLRPSGELCRVLTRSCCAAQKAGGEEAKAESGGWVRGPGPWRSSRRRGSDTVRPQGVRGAFGSFCSTLVRSSPPLAPPPSQPWPPPPLTRIVLRRAERRERRRVHHRFRAQPSPIQKHPSPRS